MRVKHPVRSLFRVVFRGAPLEAQLIVTRRCNLSCGYCTEYDKVSGVIPLDVLKQRIDALHRLRVVNIALLGGEPLLHPELPEVVAYGDRRAQVSVTTNGFLLTGPLIQSLNAAGLRNMEVSIDAVTPDRTGYIQKCLKTIRPKLHLLRRWAAFDVLVNLVLCPETRTQMGDAIRELEDLSFPCTIDLLHDARGQIAIGGDEYAELWRRFYVDRTPQAFLDQAYGARLLAGARPTWHCRAGARFLYVDEFGDVQLCSAQRGRLNKPVTDYTTRDLREQSRAHKGCEEGCSLLCAYRAAAFDNHPLGTVGSALRLAWRKLHAHHRASQASRS
ncbi:MAG TPA: radical SAM protein [Gemmatimonadales bacterium]|nr:radical SAM protein [Gemmatimonadales bacterium]